MATIKELILKKKTAKSDKLKKEIQKKIDAMRDDKTIVK